MKLSRTLAAGLILAGFAGAAIAQTAAPAQPDTTIGLGGFFAGIRPAIESLAITIVTGVVTWVGILFKSKLGRDMDARMREALHGALMTGVSGAINFAGARAADVKLDVRNQAIAEAIRWAEKSVPDALKYFGIDAASREGRDALVQIASAKLTQLAEAPSAPPSPDKTAGA